MGSGSGEEKMLMGPLADGWGSVWCGRMVALEGEAGWSRDEWRDKSKSRATGDARRRQRIEHYSSNLKLLIKKSEMRSTLKKTKVFRVNVK